MLRLTSSPYIFHILPSPMSRDSTLWYHLINSLLSSHNQSIAPFHSLLSFFKSTNDLQRFHQVGAINIHSIIKLCLQNQTPPSFSTTLHLPPSFTIPFPLWTGSIISASSFPLLESTPFTSTTDWFKSECPSHTSFSFHSYRYVSPDGTHFTYTSVLLLLQCAINFVIASAGRVLPSPLM